MSRKFVPKIGLLALAVAGVFPGVIRADDNVWLGGVNRSWSDTAGNWQLSPFSWSNIFIDTAIFSGNNPGTITVDSPITLQAIGFTANGYTISGPQQLTFANNSDGTYSAGELRVGTGVSATIGAVMAGAVPLTKTGDGTLTLTAANIYGGPTTVSGGKLQIGAGGASGSILGNVTNNAALIFNRSDTATYAGNISGTGSISNDGPGVLVLTGTNSHTGAVGFSDGVNTVFGTVFRSGTISVASDASLGAPAAPLTFGVGGGGALRVTGTSFTSTSRTIVWGGFGGTIDIADPNNVFTLPQNLAFSLTKRGPGTLTLVGSSNFTGGVTVSAGTLSVGNGGPAGVISGNITNNATVMFSRSDFSTYTGSISGSGNLVKNGAGFFQLFAAHTYAGTTTINDGIVEGVVTNTLPVTTHLVLNSFFFPGGTGQTVASLSGSGGGIGVFSNRTFTVNQNTDTTWSGYAYDNNIFGPSPDVSQFVKTGSGTLTLNGGGAPFTLGGGIRVDGGTLRIGNTASVATLTPITINSGGTFELGRFDTWGNHTTTTSSRVTVSAGGLLRNISGIFNTLVSPTLAGGNFELNPGFSTQFPSLGLKGTVTFNGSVGSLITTSSPGPTTAINIGPSAAPGDLVLNIANTSVGIDLSILVPLKNNRNDANTADQTNGLVKTGTGSLSLRAANTFTGPITVSSGLLVVGDGATSGSIASLSVTNSGTFSFDRSDTVTYGGVISGPGTFTHFGTGTVILTADHTLTGPTIVFSSLLKVGNGGTTGFIPGNIENHGVVEFSRSDFFSYSGVISGTGSVVHSGAGYRVLDGTSTYGGSTTVRGATLESAGLPATTHLILDGGGYFVGGPPDTVQTIAAVSGQGDVGIFLNKTLDLNQNINTTTSAIFYDNAVFGPSSDTGKLIKQGTGTLTATGGFVLGGGVGVLGGTLRLGNGGTPVDLRSNVQNDASLVFDFDGTYTYGRTVTGTGTLTKTGPGTLIVTQNGGSLGNLVISQGSFQLGDGVTNGGFNGYASAISTINNGDLAFNLPLGATYNGTAPGTGTLTLLGSGTITIDAPLAYTGGTRIRNGTLGFTPVGRLPVGGNVTIAQGILNIAGNSHTIGDLTFGDTSVATNLQTGARLVTNSATGSGQITLNGNLNLSGPGEPALITAPLVLSAGQHVLGNPNSRLSVAPEYDIVIGGPISGPGGLSKSGGNSGFAVVLTRPNSYAGPTLVDSGNLSLAAAGALPATADLTVNGGRLWLKTFPQSNVPVGSFDQTVASLSGAGGSVNLGAARLVLDQNVNTTFAGEISFDVGPGGELVKNGTGTFTATGTRTSETVLTVNGGTVRIAPIAVITASARLRGTTTVNPGARLEVVGTDFLDGVLNLNGTSGQLARASVLPSTTIAGRPTVVSVFNGLSVASDGAPLGTRNYFGQLVLSGSSVFRNGSLPDLSDLARAYLTSGGAQGMGGTALDLTNFASPVAIPFTQLGLALNRSPSGGFPLFGSWSGVSVSSTDVIARMTWTGDADLNGVLDARDFNALLNGWSNGLTGWLNGDNNYDGVVNATDFNRFLAAYGYYQTSGFPLGAGGPDTGSIPEPAAMALLAVAGPVLGRRRRA